MNYLFWHKEHLKEQDLIDLYGRIDADSILRKTLWYDGPPETSGDFLRRVENWWFVKITTADDHTVGTFWLNGYQGRTAQIHFAIFEEFRPWSVEIGKATLQWLADLDWLHSVYGITPATHRHVFPFIEAIGFKIMGSVPGACWVDRKQKHIAGIISAYDFGGRNENL